MNQILKILPKKRQTSLFSATQTQKVGCPLTPAGMDELLQVNDLARLSLKKPIFVQSKGADDVVEGALLVVWTSSCCDRMRLFRQPLGWSRDMLWLVGTIVCDFCSHS